jgi:hypothetical protein
VSGLWILPVYFIVAFGLVPLAILAIISSIDTFAAWVRRNLQHKDGTVNRIAYLRHKDAKLLVDTYGHLVPGSYRQSDRRDGMQPPATQAHPE